MIETTLFSPKEAALLQNVKQIFGVFFYSYNSSTDTASKWTQISVVLSCLLDVHKIPQVILNMMTYFVQNVFLLLVNKDEASDDNEDPMPYNMPLHMMD